MKSDIARHVPIIDLSIQEQISPSREDSKRQTPNIFDNKESLGIFFKYLKKKNICYCPCSEPGKGVKEK